MAAKIGFRRTPSGGFGNRVLSYLSLRQIAGRLQCGYFSINPADSKRVSGIHRPWIWPMRLRRHVEMGKDAALETDFIEQVKGLLDQGTDVIVKPPLLGEVYARFDDTDPAVFTASTMRMCRDHQQKMGARPLLTVHFRGTDFNGWNPDAILDADYYRRAFDLVKPGLSNHVVRLCTDDPDHPALDEVSQFLSSETEVVHSQECSDPFSCDFASMVHSDYLIASPSTFSLSAALLGSAKVVQSRQWADNRISRGELFWSKIRDNSLRGYKSAGLV